MIQTATTFVIGAGASQPYGWPLGATLMAHARALTPKHPAFQLMIHAVRTDGKGRDMGEAIEVLQRVLHDVRQHTAPSLDAYLESRQGETDTMMVGRLLIAVLLAHTVKTAPPSGLPPSGDWLPYVFERMRRGAPTAAAFAEGNAKVRFVTFNVDSVIESRLGDLAQRTFREWTPRDGTLLAPVVHVHGRLPPFPEAEFIDHAVTGFHPEWCGWPNGAAKSINVVLDTIDDAVLAAARGAIHQAHVVCFLGFAYERTNVERIGLTGQAFDEGLSPAMYGSAFLLEAGEQEWVYGRLHGRIKLAGKDDQCLETLRKFHIFRD